MLIYRTALRQLESVGECYFPFILPFYFPLLFLNLSLFFADLRKAVPKCRWAKEKQASWQTKCVVSGWVLVIKTEVCWLRVCWYIKWNEILLSETMKLLKKKICKLLRFPHVRVKWKGDFPPSISAFYQRQVSRIISFNKYFTAWLIAPSTFWIPVATGGPESLTPK